jgi:hypothetical protein
MTRVIASRHSPVFRRRQAVVQKVANDKPSTVTLAVVDEH